MPTYEYQCKVCGHQLEVFQKMTDEPLKECPKCHQASLDKLLSATNFQLKGTGWYATDFRDKGKPKEQKTDDTKTVEKPEKKPEVSASDNKQNDNKQKDKTSKDTSSNNKSAAGES